MLERDILQSKGKTVQCCHWIGKKCMPKIWFLHVWLFKSADKAAYSGLEWNTGLIFSSIYQFYLILSSSALGLGLDN